MGARGREGVCVCVWGGGRGVGQLGRPPGGGQGVGDEVGGGRGAACVGLSMAVPEGRKSVNGDAWL